MNLEKEIFDIMLQDIIPNRFQPREIFNDNELQELAASIKEHGVIQPIIVRKVGDKYEIIAGERRFRASQLAGKETIPALVRDIDDKEAAKIALLENLQRSNLTPIEEAKTYQTILKIDNITQDELAANLGRSQSTIANKLRLLTLNEEVQTALLNSQISERHARSLLGLNSAQQLELLHKTINEKLTVRQLDEEVMRMTGRAPSQDTELEIPGNNNEIQANMNMQQPQQPQVMEPTPTVAVRDTYPQPTPMPTQENQVVDIPTITTLEPQNMEVPVEPIVEQPPVEMPMNNQMIQPEMSVVQPEPIIEPQPGMEMPVNNIEVPIEQPSIEMPIDNQMVQPEMPVVQPEPIIEQQPSMEMPTNNIETPVEGNIFDKLRVEREETPQEATFDLKTPDINTVINPEEGNSQSYNDIYDLRFAINNFRQAVQNTEKFGFKVSSTENDLGEQYQIIINIDKK